MGKRIEEGDRVIMSLPVRKVWSDGKITIEVFGQRFTGPADHDDIEDIVKGTEKPRNRRRDRFYDRPN